MSHYTIPLLILGKSISRHYKHYQTYKFLLPFFRKPLRVVFARWEAPRSPGCCPMPTPLVSHDIERQSSLSLVNDVGRLACAIVDKVVSSDTCCL